VKERFFFKLRRITFLSSLFFMVILLSVSNIDAQTEAQKSNDTQSMTDPAATGQTEETSPSRILPAPPRITAFDVPSDDGGMIRAVWSLPEGASRPDTFILEIKGPDGNWKGVTKTSLMTYDIPRLPNNQPFQLRVKAMYDGEAVISEPTPDVFARDHWFKKNKTIVLFTIIIFVAILSGFLHAARRGVELFVRRITGLTAVEDAIGRATEMGKPVLYIPGMSYIEDVATLAALNILGEVARRTVHYDVKIICPNRDPIVYTIAREIVKETYASEGRPEAFEQDSVFFMVPDQFAFAAGVNGIMVRQRPATIFYMGTFFAESLVMAETGASTGAIQIAGTDAIGQLPFFITACDYTLIGEELYAASAYLSREPMLLGTLKCQDYAKLLFMLGMIVFTLLALTFEMDVKSWITMR
jgi:hypothetical protein